MEESCLLSDNQFNRSILLKYLPAKSEPSGNMWLPYWMHSRDTAEILMLLMEEWVPRHVTDICKLDEMDLKGVCRFLGLVHDFGKMTPAFAARITEVIPEIRQKLEARGLCISAPGEYKDKDMTPHARAGEELLLDAGCPACIASIVGAHHGKSQDLLLHVRDEIHIAYAKNYYGPTYEDSDSGHMWTSVRSTWLSFALKESGFSSVDELPVLRQPIQILLTGLLIMADWIASNILYFPLIPLDSCGDPSLYPERIRCAWEKLNLPSAWEPLTFVMDHSRFREVFPFTPNPVQDMTLRAVNESQGGLFILEAQMGVGKTEAALAAAEVLASKYRCGGIYFGLPTQATANGLFSRLADWAAEQAEGTRLAIRLAHGMAELNEEYRAFFLGASNVNDDGSKDDRLIVHPWFSGHKQALLANFVIGTVDQLLLSALKQKHVFLRHLGLSGKVVILDECHAYDAYMNQYLQRVLNWLGAYHVPVIMLSATLPEERRAELVEAYINGDPDSAPDGWRTQRAYPLLTWTEGSAVHQSSAELKVPGRSVKIQRADPKEIIPILWEAVSVGGCCGLIVNTVQYAQELMGSLKKALPDAELLLIHSRFIAPDRAEREKLLLRRIGKQSTPESRQGLIVVGTQVLEQSLDIDFDVLLTQLCPMDLLLQRIGRLRRHTRERPKGLEHAVCYVLPEDEGSRAVYGDWLLLRTGQLLPATLSLPESIPELVQETYREPDGTLLEDDDSRRAWVAHENTIKSKERRAQSYRISAPPSENGRRIRNLDGWLNAEYPAEGVRGDAAVRDGDSGITVLVMQLRQDGNVAFLPWQHKGGGVSATHMPDEETARKIAAQRLTLPLRFSSYGRAETTIRELETLNRDQLSEWQNSSWLHGELVLLLDYQLHAVLCGQQLTYSKELGLICTRKEGTEEDGI